jgi:hypothetical protein
LLGTEARHFGFARYWQNTLIIEGFAAAVANTADKPAIIEHRAVDFETYSLQTAWEKNTHAGFVG